MSIVFIEDEWDWDEIDTPAAQADADLAAELASEARAYEWEVRDRCDD